MLVLTRRENESIVINGNIVVSILELRGKKTKAVRVGIEAPKEMAIERYEIAEKKPEKETR